MLMNTTYDKGFTAGVALACAARGIPATDFIRMRSKQAALESSPIMQATMLKIASSIFHAAGEGYENDAAMYDALLAGTSRIRSTFAKRAILDPIVFALAEAAHEEEFEKLASVAGMSKQATVRLLRELGGKIAGLFPDTIQGIAALSLLVGGAGGAGWWALNRDINTNSAAVEAKEEQAKYYRELADKIRKKTGKTRSKALVKRMAEETVAAEAPEELPSSQEDIPQVDQPDMDASANQALEALYA